MPFDGGCNTPAIVDRMGGPRCLSGYTSLVDIDNIDERVRNCFGNYVFAFFVFFFVLSPVLSVFLAICGILEKETSNSKVLQHFGV